MNDSSRSPLALLCLLLLLGGCRDELTPTSPLRPSGPGPAKRVMEVTISGIGTPGMEASARFLGADGGGPALDLTPVGNSGGGGDGTIQLQSAGSGSFKAEEPDGTMTRWIYATFRVRNAQQNGTPYDTPRENLTFVAVSTASTIGDTPITDLRLFDETLPADPLLAFEIRPTGAVVADPHSGAPVSAGPDALQVLTEVEAAEVEEPAYVRSVFPYGFVVRNATVPTTRTLPANPGADQYDGVVTFSFKVPLQPSGSEDPYRIRMSFLVLDDSETRLTQSPEEQSAAGLAAMQARASALGATTITTLPGVRVPGARGICSVRTAGTALAPTHFMVRGGAFLTPDPFSGAASFLAVSTSFSANHGDLVFRGNPQTFVVNGSQRGRYFLAGPFTGNGTTTVSSPVGTFFPGEQVEISLTATLRTCAPQVARYRVGAAAASATFASAAGSPVLLGDNPRSVVAGDFNADGRLDLAVALAPSGTDPSVRILQGNGSGGFTALAPIPLGLFANALEFADADADGRLDLLVAAGNAVRFHHGDGAGGFTPGLSTSVAGPVTDIALADFNADGHTDIAASTSLRLWVLLNNGVGQFAAAPGSPLLFFDVGPSGVAAGDLDQDGNMDVVMTTSASSAGSAIRVFRGDGTGRLSPTAGTVFGPAGVSARSPQVADFNGDGRLDVAALTTFPAPGSLLVFLGDGTGSLTAAPGSPSTPAPGPVNLSVGDLNGDARLDLAITREGIPGAVAVLLGNGAGQFSAASGSPVIAGTTPHAAELADFNGDGRLDMAVTNSLSDNLSVLLNQP